MALDAYAIESMSYLTTGECSGSASVAGARWAPPLTHARSPLRAQA